MTAALHQVVTLARLTVPGCDGASITQVKKAQFVTLAATDQLVREVEQLQLELRQGPCLDAAAQDGCYRADDLTQDATWPRFAAHATAATPVRSLLSVTIHPLRERAALNLYSHATATFDDTSVDTATVFAAQAQVLLMYLHASDTVGNLNRALTTSRLIGAAVGILMYAHRITADQAFDRLARASTNLNRKLTDIAEEVTHTGALPRRPHN